MKLTHLLAPTIILSSSLIQASVLIPMDAAAWDKGGGGTNGTGNGGLLKTTTDQLHINKHGDLNDPSVWTNETESYFGDFQGQDVASLTGSPWIVYDLGTSYANLDTVYIITNVEANRGFKDIEIHFSNDISSNNVTTWASLSALTDGGANVVDYDFTAGGWTQHGGTYTLTDVNDAFGTQEQPATGIDISGIASARYIGIVGLNTFDGGSSGRAGINQIAFTTADVIPEPSTFGLLLVGALGMLSRRRR